jgi:hypothetical protein
VPAGKLARFIPTLIVLGLLGGTAAAFAVTEGLKLEKSPVARTRIDPVFSPVCDCAKQRARIAFRLAKADGVTLSIVDSSGRHIRTLLLDRRIQGFHRFTWNGRDDAGRIVPQGTYKVRIQLSDLDRTFDPPNAIQVDTTAPTITPTTVGPAVFSPDGDHRADKIAVGYKLSEPARVFLDVNGHTRIRSKIRPDGGRVFWYGIVSKRALRAGRYRLELLARDRAGNTSQPAAAGFVHIRYIKIVGDVIEGRTGRRTRVFVSTDSAAYRWSIGRHSGVAHSRLLLVPPLKAGRYRLVVVEHGHLDAATIVVRKRRG